MPQLDISTYIPQLFWLLVLFLIFFFMSYYVFVPRINKTIEERSDLIYKNKESAELNKFKASEVITSLNKEFEDLIKKSDDDIREKKILLFKQFSNSRDEIRAEYKKKLKGKILEINNELLSVKNDFENDILELSKNLEKRILND